MTHHVFRHEHRVENFAVMNVERQADKIRRNHRTPRPRFDRRLLIRSLGLLDFFLKVEIYKRTFFNRATHKLFVFHWPAITADQNKPVRILLLLTRAQTFRDQTPRRSKLLPATAGFRFTRATTVRMVNWIARHTTTNRANAAMPGTACFAENHI